MRPPGLPGSRAGVPRRGASRLAVAGPPGGPGRLRAPRRRAAQRPESGAVTVFAVLVIPAMLLTAALIVDGGLGVDAQLRAVSEAQEAARAGAQAINLAVYRQTGQVVLIPAQAIAGAGAYLAATGDTGTVSVSGDAITVTVTRRQPAELLRIAGITALTAHGTATATAEHGVLVPGG